MKFSQFVFPAPNPPTYSRDGLLGELLYVPKDFNQKPYKYIKKERARSRQNSRDGRTTPRSMSRLQ